MKRIANMLALVLLGTALTMSVVAGDKDKEKDGKAAKAKPYPLDTCLVSGEKLGGMGEGYTFTQNGQEIKLCCKDCLKEFNKDKKKFLSKLDDAKKEKKPKDGKAKS